MLERGANLDGHARIAGLVAKNGPPAGPAGRGPPRSARVSPPGSSRFRGRQRPFERRGRDLSRINSGRPPSAKGIELVAELDDDDRARSTPTPSASSRSSGTCSPTRSNSPAAADGSSARPPGRRGAVTLVVADTGVGFESDVRGGRSKPFRQADSSASREHGGLGLGLSIARHIAELHGGSLTGSSQGIGHGARSRCRCRAQCRQVPGTDLRGGARQNAGRCRRRPSAASDPALIGSCSGLPVLALGGPLLAVQRMPPRPPLRPPAGGASGAAAPLPRPGGGGL